MAGNKRLRVLVGVLGCVACDDDPEAPVTLSLIEPASGAVSVGGEGASFFVEAVMEPGSGTTHLCFSWALDGISISHLDEPIPPNIIRSSAFVDAAEIREAVTLLVEVEDPASRGRTSSTVEWTLSTE